MRDRALNPISLRSSISGEAAHARKDTTSCKVGVWVTGAGEWVSDGCVGDGAGDVGGAGEPREQAHKQQSRWEGYTTGRRRGQMAELQLADTIYKPHDHHHHPHPIGSVADPLPPHSPTPTTPPTLACWETPPHTPHPHPPPTHTTPPAPPWPAGRSWRACRHHTPRRHPPACAAWRWRRPGSRGCNTAPHAPGGGGGGWVVEGGGEGARFMSEGQDRSE
jgi:hypothetical protein